MTLQQLRYLIAVAESGSINAAAQSLYTAQSNISSAIKTLEGELGISIFTRSRRGVMLTNDGMELLGYARQVVEQANMLEVRYAQNKEAARRIAVSTQHYAFCVKAFINIVNRCSDESFEFIMRETTTAEIIDDVRAFRSEIGILYLDDFNKRILQKAFEDAHVSFHPLLDAGVHVFVNANHPLAHKEVIELEELEPYSRYSFEQGTSNSFYYAEEPFSYVPCKRNIRVSDRATYSDLLQFSNGYALSTGVLSTEMLQGVVSIPLAGRHIMRVGYITHDEREETPIIKEYLNEVRKVVKELGADGVTLAKRS